ncbi:hypothetical protein ACLNGM_20745 [Aureimonas phyllosphaerae]|uniref:hypothetical protein n=1 Tax=Aureimonas phyllosphaerae TaxID=1166078 RepID=UPI003A5BD1B0
MSYLSPEGREITASNDRQPTDMNRDAWTSMLNTHGSDPSLHPTQGMPWLFRQPPRLRHPHAKL